MLARFLAAVLLGAGWCAHAAPFTPATDSEVVERLPLAGDPAARRIDSLRKQLAARPDDAALRIEIARRYFDLAMAQGDPRYVGYASAAIAPLHGKAEGVSAYWFVQGLIQQYSHDFSGAIKSLVRASELDPRAAEPIAWQAAVEMVQARYRDALGECTRLVPLATPLLAHGCTAYVHASTGQLEPAYEALAKAVAQAIPTRAWPCGCTRGWRRWRCAWTGCRRPNRISGRHWRRASPTSSCWAPMPISCCSKAGPRKR
jgi:tetratricopeptide (TPR) repeat protein